MSALLRPRHAEARPLAVADWSAPATAAEVALLAAVDGPVLDLGCGPGRLVVALAEQGIPALGIDASPAAVATAHQSGAPVLCRSIFDRVPGHGRWGTVLLFDGNIGIGGDPVRLLRRAASLLAARGSLLVEADPPGWPTAVSDARVEAHGVEGPWFPWAWVAADDLPTFADTAGLAVAEWLRPDDRWIARLQLAGA